jgi:AcrR family transcriptional regulator
VRGDEAAEPVVRRGRYAEAERNNAAILEAARDVFLADPTAPISAVAKRAGVGIGALYHRYAAKEDLLATLCLQGQDRYLAEVRDALGVTDDPWEAYVGFLRRIVAADTHSLVVRLAGTFTPTAEHLARAEQMEELGTQLFQRARGTGKLRADVTFLDVSFLLELIAKSSLDTPERTAELRQRQLAILIDGLAAVHAEPLPGASPTWHEQRRRWG